MSNESEIDGHLKRLREDGFTVLEGVVPHAGVAALVDALERLQQMPGFGYARTEFEGLNTVRINNLLAYDEAFWQVPVQPDVLAIAEHVLEPELLLSSFCSLILGPGQGAQPLHADTQLIPLPRPHMTITLNAIWALSDFTEENGATRIVPGSHRLDHPPEYGREYETIPALMPAGSIMLFDSALWHAGGTNHSTGKRFGLSCAYCLGWMRQQENLQLGIPAQTARRFPRRLQELCGYSVYKGQFGHIDNHDPIELLGRPRGKRMVWEASDIKKARAGATRDVPAAASLAEGKRSGRVQA